MIASHSRAIPGAVLALILAACRADALELVDLHESQPGRVQATVSTPVGAPPLQASQLSLALGDTSTLLAQSVTGAPLRAAPAWLLLCLDSSGSVGSAALADIRKALHTALLGRPDADLPFNVALMPFGTHTTAPPAFTNRASVVSAAIEALRPDAGPHGRTMLYDTIAGGLAALRAAGDGAKRLVVVSDGKDEGSLLSQARLAEVAQAAPAIAVDAVAYGAQARASASSLATLSGATGGRFVPAPDAAALAGALQRLVEGVNPAPRYAITFAYAPAADQRRAESSTLVYEPPGSPAQRIPVSVPLALAAVAAQEAAPPAAAPQRADERHTVVDLMLWVRSLPTLLLALAGAGVAIVLALAWFIRRRPSQPLAPPAQPPQRERTEASGVSVAPAEPPAASRRRATIVGTTWAAPAPGHPCAFLRGLAGGARGKRYQIDRGLYRIGSASDNDLVLVGDDFASSYHAQIRFEAGALYLEDLGSTNGSRLNDAPLKGATRSLSLGDTLRFGRTSFELEPGLAAQGAHSGLEAHVR